tara:strand:+ start:1091 stop:1834 length:744 start_codon:yes stop_codon:yes gene_type:complete
MAYILDEVWVNNGQLIVAEAGVNPSALGDGVGKVKHSAYVEGPLQVGNAGDFGSAEGTVMIGADGNMGAAEALKVKGGVVVDPDKGDIHDSNLKNVTGQSCSFSSSTINVQSWKGFDIKHPNKEGHRLRHICLEGPEAGVYYRGRIKNEKMIRLPSYWKGLVNIDTITVQLQPIGAHQNIIIKRWDDEFIYLQGQGGMPINCFYHVFGERIDGEKLIIEYEGDTPDKYPGDQSQYSISGYHYDRRTL